MVKTASVFSRLETMEYLSGKRQVSTDKLFKIIQVVRKKAGFHGQTRTEAPRQTRGRVSRTDADCGLTDKRGLRFTDRRSLDFPDTCHLDFPDVSYLDFPYTRHLNFPYTHPPHKATKIRNYKLRPEKWNNLRTSWRLVVKKC